jgi:hypothetical protein
MTLCRFPRENQRGKPGRWAAALPLAIAWQATHCAVNEDIVARRLQQPASGGSSNAGAPAAQAGGDGAGAPAGQAGSGGAGAPAGQAGSGGAGCIDGPVVATSSTTGETRDRCSGWAARRSFSHALCSCADVSVPAALTSLAGDSSATPGDPAGSAAVGINGNYQQTEYLRVGGTLTIGGSLELSSTGGIDVAGDLRLTGPASAAGPIVVGRDAWLLAETSSLSLVRIDRDLYLGPNATATSFGPVLVDGERREESFALAPPCACADGELLDVPGIVQDGMGRNDNARIGLDSNALDTPGGPVSLTLECGRFALQRIAGAAPINLRINGNVALFVDDSAQLGQGFTLELGAEAELDWFVRGTVSLDAGASIGASARPGAARLYTIAPGDLTLPGTARVALNVYAPRMNVSVRGLGDVYGALFAASVTAPGALIVHYDRSVVAADEGCPLPAPTTCSGCDDCAASTACVLGACAACGSDADCCFPQVCAEGACGPLRSN